MAARTPAAIRRPICHAAYLLQVYQVRNLRTDDNLRTLKVKILSFAVNRGTRSCQVGLLNLAHVAPAAENRDSPALLPERPAKF